MKKADLKKLNRAELLTMLLSVTQRCEDLETQLEEANAKLAERNLSIAAAGTMAEAILKVNGVMEAADRAAADYIENARRYQEEARRLKEEYLKKAGYGTGEADPAAEKGTDDSGNGGNDNGNGPGGTASASSISAAEAEALRRERMAAVEDATRKRCAAMIEQAKEESQAYWEEVYARLREYCEQTDHLKGLFQQVQRADG